MFDPKVPYNDLPLLYADTIKISDEYSDLLIQANQEIGKLDGISLLLPNYELLIVPLLSKESVASNAIENINTTTIEFLQKQALGDNTLSGAEKEVLNYRNTILKGVDLMKKYGGISTNMLVELQQLIEPAKIGIRKTLGTVISNGLGEVLYTPPVGEEHIRSLLSNLETWIHDDLSVDPLLKMPVIHYQFESIHPFYDGNGRMGRILMMLYLIYTNKLQNPVLFLSSYILENRQEYYTSLNKGNRKKSYIPIVIFLLKGVIQESRKTQEKIIHINDFFQKTVNEFKNVGVKDYYTLVLLFFESPFVTISALIDRFSITRQSAATYVDKLEKAGLIKTIKIGSYKLSYLSHYIELLQS